MNEEQISLELEETAVWRGLFPAMDLLAAIRAGRLGDDSWLVAFEHPGDPASKARPRFTSRGNRTYTPTRTLIAQRALAERFQSAMKGRMIEGNVAIAAVFYRPNRQRIDADNLMKLVLDAATAAGVWLDDSQVTAQASVVELDAERPRTLVALGPTTSSLSRRPLIQICPRCGTHFEAPRLRRPKVYCSRACAQLKALARCARCGTEFRRRGSGQRYCSRACAQRDPLVRQRAALQRQPATCVTCGGTVSRREYRQCWNCAPKGRRLGSKNRPPGALVKVETLEGTR